MKNKKSSGLLRRVLKPVAFVTIFLLLLAVISTLLTPKSSQEIEHSKNSTANMIRQETENSLDIIAIGNSNLWASFSPMELWQTYGYTGYNCATSGQRMWEGYAILKQALERQQPKVVLLETDMVFQNGQASEAMLQAEAAVQSEMQRLLPVFQYHNRWKKMSAVMKDKEDAVRNPNKGYNYRTVTHPYAGGITPGSTTEKEPPSHVANAYLQRLRLLCEKKGIKLVLFTAPCAIYWTQKQHNTMQAYAEKYDLPFFDFNLLKDEIGFQWNSDMRDEGIHLNHSGAKKMTLYLGKWLSHEGLIAGHQGDPAYTLWEQDTLSYGETSKAPKTILK